MADIISNQIRPDREAQGHRNDWPLIAGVGLSILALTYLAAAAHARYAVEGQSPGSSQSIWFPLELFVIAITPALVGFIFLWSERHLQGKATQRLLRNLGLFGVGLILAAWAAAVFP
ncbi:MAG: hypothetical protein B7Z77_05210 [Acidocella sp. 20-58-15]|nr:MAG: hypothetical protein B7Z77_05210 [Acidocella sp. 20-58-15]